MSQKTANAPSISEVAMSALISDSQNSGLHTVQKDKPYIYMLFLCVFFWYLFFVFLKNKFLKITTKTSFAQLGRKEKVI